MTEQLNSSLVRICTKNTSYVGVGILVSLKHILTCAHVVNGALGRPNLGQEQPTESIYLDFPYAASGQVFSAKVIFWQPVQQNQAVLRKMGGDIAVLELDELAPLQAKPSQLKLVSANELRNHPFEVFGVPVGNPSQGVYTEGLLLWEVPNGWIQISSKEGYQIERGFSGSPVWDTQLNAVVGITVATDPKRPEVKVGFMIPTQMLFRAWSELEQIKEQTKKKIVAQYKQALSEAFPQEFPLRLSDKAQQQLRLKQHELGLTDEDVKLIEKEIINQHIAKHSDAGVDYTELANLLRVGKWKEANRETLTVMLKVVGCQDYLDSKSIENFPCKDLLTIDKIWVKYSKGRLGFSVQKCIWESLKHPDLEDQCRDFGNQVGWRRKKEWLMEMDKLTFNSSVDPKGHLPWVIEVLIDTNNKIKRKAEYPIRTKRIGEELRAFFSRVDACSL